MRTALASDSTSGVAGPQPAREDEAFKEDVIDRVQIFGPVLLPAETPRFRTRLLRELIPPMNEAIAVAAGSHLYDDELVGVVVIIEEDVQVFPLVEGLVPT